MRRMRQRGATASRAGQCRTTGKKKIRRCAISSDLVWNQIKDFWDELRIPNTEKMEMNMWK